MPLNLHISRYRRLLVRIALLSITTTSIPTAVAAVEALRITKDNAAQLIQQGPDATGGIGDWFFSNGTLCAVISDIEHENEFSSKGGTLVDLGFCGRADDHFTTAQDMLDGQQTRPMDIHQVDFDIDADQVSVTTQGRADGVVVDTRYTLSTARPTELSISKRVRVVDDEKPGFNFYAPFWFNYHSMEPFVFSSKHPANTRGFNNEDFVTRGSSAIRQAAINADTVIMAPPADAQYGIAYGWQLKSAKRVSGDISYEVPHFVLADDESVVMLILADSFYFGDGSYIGLLQLPQMPLLSLDVGDSLEIEEILYVGARSDVASVTDQLWPVAVTVAGRLADTSSALHVELADGTPYTFVRPAADGSFHFRAAAGDYRLRQRGTAGRELTTNLKVGADDQDLGTLALPPAAQLNLPRGEAMRLVFVGLEGTENPDFEDRLTDYAVHDDEGFHNRSKISQLFLAGVDSDPKQVDLAPGKYRVYATRGPEYSLGIQDISMQTGKAVNLEIDLPKQTVATPGYIAADLHVHSGISFDNTFPELARVRTFVAEHGEIMVSSEHDVLVDYAPYIRELGVMDKITSIAATEMTSLLLAKSQPFTGGHLNFFPVQPQTHAYRQGMVSHEDRRLRDVLHEFRENHPGVLAQMNHARQNLSLSGALPKNYQKLIYKGGYLDHMGVAAYPYNPEEPLHSHPNNSLIEKHPQTGVRDIDVDAFEIINPGDTYHQERILALRKDWLSFLAQGLRMTGTANSDSHHSGQQVAVPRNMVRVIGDSVAEFDQSEFLASLKSGNSYGTTGPMLEVSLSGSQMGQSFSGNQATLKLEIRSADWIPVDAIRIQVNGRQITEVAVAGKREFAIPLEFSQDSFVTIEVSGPANDAYEAIYPGLTPYAFSNPIYVDADSDGKWSPPGL